MATTKEQLTELRQYIEDLEVGLAMRLDGLGARLDTIDSKLALIGSGLFAKKPSEAEAAPPLNPPRADSCR